MAITKKTAAAKPAAKTTVKKPTATKTAATAKTKATATKVAVKKAPVATKTSTNDLSVTGNKKIGTLMKEFNKKFPYLRLKYVIVTHATL